MIGKARRDGLGLGMSKDKLLKFEVGNHSIVGIVCSANNIFSMNPYKSKKLNCESKVEANSDLAGQPMD